MKKTVLLLVLLLAFSASATGCGGAEKQVLYVYNWGDYIDESVNEQFEQEYNCRVVYDLYDSNEAMYYKIKSGSTKYDVIFPSDYMVEKMLREGMLLELDKDNIPNIANIRAELLGMYYDPENKYTVPYFMGTVGILYNPELVGGDIDSWEVLFDSKYSKQIVMYDSQRDSLGVALKYLGYSMNTRDLEQLKEAEELLIKQKPLVLAYYTDYIKNLLIREEAALGVVYSGDAVFAMSENDKLQYAVPKEGSNVWFDNVAIPSTAQNKELAEKYIDFLCRDEIALLNTSEVMYTTVNKNIESELRQTDWADNDTYFVPQDVFERCELFNDPGDFITEYSNAWERVKGN